MLAATGHMQTELALLLVYAVIGWIIRILVYPPKTYKQAIRSWFVGCLLAVMMSDPVTYYVKGFIDIPRYELRNAVAGILAMSGADLITAVGRFLRSKIEAKDNTKDGNDNPK